MEKKRKVSFSLKDQRLFIIFNLWILNNLILVVDIQIIDSLVVHAC